MLSLNPRNPVIVYCVAEGRSIMMDAADPRAADPLNRVWHRGSCRYDRAGGLLTFSRRPPSAAAPGWFVPAFRAEDEPLEFFVYNDGSISPVTTETPAFTLVRFSDGEPDAEAEVLLNADSYRRCVHRAYAEEDGGVEFECFEEDPSNVVVAVAEVRDRTYQVLRRESEST